MDEDTQEIHLIDQLEIRSEEMQEILGYIPNWIVRWGILVITISVIGLLVGSWFFRYPDILSSTVTVITENPPVSIISHSSGKIRHLFVKDKQSLKAETLLAVIDNAADHEHVLQLKEQLKKFRPLFSDLSAAPPLPINRALSLGELQPAFETFLKNYDDFLYFRRLQYHQKKIAALQVQIEKHRSVYIRLQRQLELIREEYGLGKKDFGRSEELLKGGFISEKEFESKKAELMQKEYALEGAESSLENEKLQISTLENSILDLQLQYREQQNGWETGLKQAYDNLLSQIAQWEYRFLLKSPIDGTVTFTTYWSENQHVNINETVFTIVPADAKKIVGKLMLPIQGSGKVKPGQDVNIKFANFPYMEYGMVRGKVRSVSLVPAEKGYLVEVDLPQDLMTNYRKKLPFFQQMQGTGEVITEDVRMLERVFQPLKNILKKK